MKPKVPKGPAIGITKQRYYVRVELWKALGPGHELVGYPEFSQQLDGIQVGFDSEELAQNCFDYINRVTG